MEEVEKIKRGLTVVFISVLFGFVLAGCKQASENPDPVRITVWTYYNGSQLESFNRLVQEFNETTGREKNIVVENYSQGSVGDLEQQVRNSAEGRVDAEPLPHIFSAYADTAYYLDQLGLVVDLKHYMAQEELASYWEAYLEEGDLDGTGSLKIFPVVKSTELLFLNDTDWKPFAEANGLSYENLATLEGLVQTAECYYRWTDAQTETPEDGRALFGRDAMANYLFVGAKELGDSIGYLDENRELTVSFQRETARKLWDFYYIPFIKGYFSAAGRFRSDDVRLGEVLAYVGSSSSASFFPAEVIQNEEAFHPIDLKVLPCSRFAQGEPYAIQQGAGMVVTQKSETEIQASVEFLKWFTRAEHNIRFAVETGYLPVIQEAGDLEQIRSCGVSLSPAMEQVLEESLQTVHENKLYTPAAFAYGKELRQVLERSMSELAEQDREIIRQRRREGMSTEDAMKEFLTDEYFESWYQGIRAALKEYEKKTEPDRF